MAIIREYLLSITVASIICGMVAGITKKDGTISAIIKLLSGIFLTITMLAPIIRFPLSNITLHVDTISADAAHTVAVGKQIAADEMKTIIISNTRTYILEKAEKLGADIDVEVYLQDLIPKSVRIIGQVSPYTKLQLTSYISEELGIAVEDQQWIE